MINTSCTVHGRSVVSFCSYVCRIKFLLIYISVVHISPINGNNYEDLQCLDLEVDQPRFCVFSLSFSACGKEIINGTSDGCIYIFDRYLNRRTSKIPVMNFLRNEIDVNAVGFLDDSSNVMFSGMDDGVVKLWDRRCLDETNPEPIGILVGHLDGITYINSKNDGRHLISNSKDQSIKLWDVRAFSKSGAEERHIRLIQATRNINDWDYRWDEVPKECKLFFVFKIEIHLNPKTKCLLQDLEKIFAENIGQMSTVE